MAMTPEGKVKAKVKDVLKRYGAYWHCPVQNGMGSPSLDFVCCIKGRYFAIETKAGNKKPTPRQEETIRQIQSAGGRAFVINELTGMQLLEEWLSEVTDG
jgi:hypothetical protein